MAITINGSGIITGVSNLASNVALGGTLSVTGAITGSNTLNSTGAISTNGNITTSANVSLSAGKIVLPDGGTIASALGSMASAGYQKLPGGLIIQWGSGGVANAGTLITLPVAFPTACLMAIAGMFQGGTAVPAEVYSTSTTQIGASTAYGGTCNISWIAIGY